MSQESGSAPSPRSLDSASLRATAIEAALATGPGIRAAFRGGVTAREKTNAHDLVTDSDENAERILAEFLLKAYPDSTFWGEENTQGADSNSSQEILEWIVDPIDGTSNFVHGVAMFSVSIAATINQELVAGVVYDPIAEIVFSADESGAFINDQPLARNSAAAIRSDERTLSLFTDYPSAEAIAQDGQLALEAFGDLVETFATVRRPVSTAQSLAHIAAGWSDVWFGFGLKAWDVAAGAFIVQQAGGRFEAIGDSALESSVENFSEYDDAHPLTAPAYFALGPGVESETTYSWVTRILDQRAHGPQPDQPSFR